MPEEYVEDPEDEFDYEEDWQEDSSDRAASNVSVSLAGQEATLVGYIPFNKQRSAAKFFCGSSWAETESPYLLHREPPQVHPLWPQLRAAGVTFQGVGPIAGDSEPGDDGPPEDGASGTPVWSTSPFTRPDGGDMWFSTYDLAVATIRFKSFGRVRFLGDDVVARWQDEYKRYVEVMTESQVQALSADGSSQLKFAEGDPGTGSIAFPAPVAELLTKCQYAFRWLDVPFEYVSAHDEILTPWRKVSDGVYRGILPLLGKWNTDPFPGPNGFPAGTLLFTAVKFEPMQFLYPSTNEDFPFTGYAITAVYEFFDPKKGVEGSAYRGHRLYPWRKDGLWYYAQREDGSNKDFIKGDDLNRIFQNVNDDS